MQSLILFCFLTSIIVFSDLILHIEPQYVNNCNFAYNQQVPYASSAKYTQYPGINRFQTGYFSYFPAVPSPTASFQRTCATAPFAQLTLPTHYFRQTPFTRFGPPKPPPATVAFPKTPNYGPPTYFQLPSSARLDSQFDHIQTSDFVPPAIPPSYFNYPPTSDFVPPLASPAYFRHPLPSRFVPSASPPAPYLEIQKSPRTGLASSNITPAIRPISASWPQHPPPNRFRDFAPIFHAIDRKWAPDGYDAHAEENDMVDDFNGRSLVAPGQYPHMAALGFHASVNATRAIVFKCGGSLISELFVLTAAHCCNDNGQAPVVVKIGDINLREQKPDAISQRRLVAHYYLHPAYDSSQLYNDIALVQLNFPIEYTKFVRPIRLWAEYDMPYQKVFTMGYGSTSFARAPTNILTELDLSIVPLDVCNKSFPPHAGAPYGILESQICAKDFERNRDTCQGDSGGPLQLNLERRRRRGRYRYYLVGIISYGKHCRSSYPGVYTRVSYYIDWLASIVWPQFYTNFS